MAEKIYLFYDYDSELESPVVQGVVHVEDDNDGEVVAVQVIPETFTEYLKQNIYGKPDPYIKMLGGDDKFDPDLMSHWEQLPLMYRINGYSGVSGGSVEEFDEYCKALGIEDEAD